MRRPTATSAAASAAAAPLDLDAIDGAPGVATLGGREVALGRFTARDYRAYLRLQELTPADPQYDALEARVLGRVFPALSAEEIENLGPAQQAGGLARCVGACEAALVRALAAAQGDAEAAVADAAGVQSPDDSGNAPGAGGGAGAAGPSTASTPST